MFAEPLEAHPYARAPDQRVRIYNASWSDYQRQLELRGEGPVPRLTYTKGILELMSPSWMHESMKSMIGRLIETWCLEKDVEFRAAGSWTLENKDAERGLEPDECYVFGDVEEPVRPDLAIEVIWTSGGLDKREIYRAIGVPELWIWHKGRITLYVLGDQGYTEATSSRVLAGIDLDQLVRFLDRKTASQAIKDYRAALRG